MHVNRGDAKPFRGSQNMSTRIDVFEELSLTAEAALRRFFVEIGAAHYVDEVLMPTLRLGDARIFAAVRDRPWPPWGLGARTISAVCEIHEVAPESWAASPVLLAADDATNIALTCALYKEMLESLAVSEVAEICYLAIEGSILADHVLRSTGFRRDDDVVLTEDARYFTYRAPARELLERMRLDAVSTPDVLAYDMDESVLAQNALFHQTLQMGHRADLLRLRVIPEIIGLPRGGHAAKPAGVPGGTGTGLGTDQVLIPGSRLPFVALSNFLGDDIRMALLDEVMSRQSAFRPATVQPEDRDAPVVDENMRRAAALSDVEFVEDRFLEPLKAALGPALSRLEVRGFPIGDIELQVTASNDGDYYRMHRDDGASSRMLSFVYFFYREPRRFSGGELRIYDDRDVHGQAHADDSHLLTPRQDTLVLFPSSLPHELLPVRVPAKQFPDSRFTVNGWIHRARDA